MSISQADFRAAAAAFLVQAQAYNVLAQNAGGPDGDFQVASDNLATVVTDLGVALFLPTPVFALSTITGCTDLITGRNVTSIYINSRFGMSSAQLLFANSNSGAGPVEYLNWSTIPPSDGQTNSQWSGNLLTVWCSRQAGYSVTLQINDGTSGGPFFLPLQVWG
jgi:hypothetical protein